MIELKECPFCGNDSEQVIRSGYGLYWVECEGCNSRGPNEHMKREAIKSWNARADYHNE